MAALLLNCVSCTPKNAFGYLTPPAESNAVLLSFCFSSNSSGTVSLRSPGGEGSFKEHEERLSEVHRRSSCIHPERAQQWLIREGISSQRAVRCISGQYASFLHNKKFSKRIFRRWCLFVPVHSAIWRSDWNVVNKKPNYGCGLCETICCKVG